MRRNSWNVLLWFRALLGWSCEPVTAQTNVVPSERKVLITSFEVEDSLFSSVSFRGILLIFKRIDLYITRQSLYQMVTEFSASGALPHQTMLFPMTFEIAR